MNNLKDKYKKFSDSIKGHVVHFPTKFLDEENLQSFNPLKPSQYFRDDIYT